TAVYSGDEKQSNPVSATTPPFQTTFTQQTLPNPDGGWQGWTLVQRIEAARLTTSGTQVRITLQASSAAGATGASIDRIYISQPSSAPGAHPYDSAADLTKIYEIMDAGVPLVMAKGQTKTVPAVNQTGVNYNLDPTKPLLIAVDFTDGKVTAP